MARIATALTVAALAVGCGTVSSQRPAPLASSDQPAPLVSIQPAQVTTKIGGATPKQRSVLLKILAGLGPTPVRAVHVAPKSKDVGGPADAVELNIQISPDDRIANWQAELIAEAFKQRSRELRLSPVVFFNAGHGGDSLPDHPELRRGDPGLTLAQAREIAERLREAATRNDAHVRRLELLRPRRFAFNVVLEADDPATFLLRGYEKVLKPLDDLRGQGYDGLSIEVVDGEGESVMVSGGWFSVRKDVAACAPVIVSPAMSDSDSPPCPASP